MRIRLRPLALADLPHFLRYRSDPDVMRYQGYGIFDRERAEGFLAEHSTLSLGQPGRWVQIGIEHVERGRLIGDLGTFFNVDVPGTMSIGYTLDPTYQGQGYAGEAVRALIERVFAEHGITRVVASMLVPNVRSIRLAERLGFRRETTKRGVVQDETGRWLDEHVYAVDPDTLIP